MPERSETRLVRRHATPGECFPAYLFTRLLGRGSPMSIPSLPQLGSPASRRQCGCDDVLLHVAHLQSLGSPEQCLRCDQRCEPTTRANAGPRQVPGASVARVRRAGKVAGRGSASGPTRGLPFRFAGSAGMRRRYVLRRPGAVSSRLPGPVRGDCAVPAIPTGHVGEAGPSGP